MVIASGLAEGLGLLAIVSLLPAMQVAPIIVLDRQGRLAAATSTGGLFGKRAGRVGDTPITGIGNWADGNLAISCTGIGEAFIYAGGARDIAARIAYGSADLDDACAAMLAEVAHQRGDGGVIAIDRSGAVTMAVPFMRSYCELLVKTCHRRGAFAMGGMAAQIPIKGSAEANEVAFAKVRADKEREASNGHDGTWVAHPDMVALANEVFTPSDAAVTEAREILAAMEAAKARGEGATVYKGRLVDIASIKQAEVIVRQFELMLG